MQDPFASVVGQPKAVAHLQAAATRPVHAYLFVGPAGSGKRNAARAFAAALLSDPRPLHDTHPDVTIVEREGASISVAQAREIGRLAARSPVEGNRKVLVLTEFHLVDEAAPALLKTIEEASVTTIFVILADQLTKELVTVASRCVKVEFYALPPALIASTLEREGVAPDRAAEAASSAFGNLDRARLLAADDEVATRHALWLAVPGRLDGTGASAAVLANHIVKALDQAMAPLLDRQASDLEHVKATAKEVGITAGSAKTVDAKHKREQRRLRADELRAGFATLADIYGKKLADASDARSVAKRADQLKSIDWANRSIEFNPNELLLLQGLFTKLNR